MNVERMHSQTFHRYELDHGLAHHNRLMKFLRHAVGTFIGSIAYHDKLVADGERNVWDFSVGVYYASAAVSNIAKDIQKNLGRSNPFLTRSEYQSRNDDIDMLLDSTIK